MEGNLLSGEHLYNIKRQSGKTQIWRYDIKTFEIKRWYLWTREPLSRTTCIIELPNGELFCYGNDDPRTGISYIIDLKTMTVKRRVFDGVPCCNAGGLYFQNSVFFLRSIYGKHPCTRMDKYDIIEDRWKCCFAFYNAMLNLCSCTVFKNSILFCALNWKIIYQFDININSCSEILFIDDSVNQFKILFAGNSRAYIAVKQTGIFESDLENQFAWQNVGKFNCDFHMNYCLFKKLLGDFYFLSFFDYLGFSCYRFDLKTKKMNKLKLKYVSSKSIIN
ncbi:unnamed protein product [Blepharisma stoltei]|uniref:F-box associated domain-containing protein n=1 Tax=Blepharisma stoltei TaxID=1481888 RepID=A0AAU9K7I6_9CILI|nr:unnamed protein product [Blepharisma stoltei]